MIGPEWLIQNDQKKKERCSQYLLSQSLAIQKFIHIYKEATEKRTLPVTILTVWYPFI